GHGEIGPRSSAGDRISPHFITSDRKANGRRCPAAGRIACCFLSFAFVCRYIDYISHRIERSFTMFAAQRRDYILAQLNKHQQVTVKQLAAELGISEGTLRTDLRIMEEEGLLERTHGGAVPPRNRYGAASTPFASRSE